MPELICSRYHCRTPLVERSNALGRLVFACPACERRAHGLCPTCPTRLPSRKHLRCEKCAHLQKRRLDRENKAVLYRDPAARAHLLELKRRSYHRPAVKVRRSAYGARYRATHPRPRDEYDRLYHREWARQRRRSRVGGKRRSRERERVA
jgi:hypothetical protein